MLRSAAELRVSKHAAALSFETAASRPPQDEAAIASCSISLYLRVFRGAFGVFPSVFFSQRSITAAIWSLFFSSIIM